jgi:ABC-type transport system involved in cytochrome c biogenesis permease component
MVFLPIVNRELRVAARRPRTYYGRMAAAAVWAALAAYFLVAISIAGFRRSDGGELFRIVSGALFIWAVICAWAGADSISVEKREGTLGFLFLTDLKSHDIVLGKLVAAALLSFYGSVAILPLLSICLMMGGVTVWQYAKAGLAIMDVFFLGHAVGIFSSALCRKRGNATGLPFLVLLLYVAASNLAAMAATRKGWRWPAFLFEYNNPVHPLSMAMRDTTPRWTMARTAEPGYWIPLLIVNLHGWIFLALAAWVLPRRWRDQPKKEGIWHARWDRWRFGSLAARTAFRKKLVTVNPILWLVCRGRFSPAFVWSVMGTVALSIVAFAI